MSGIQVQKVSWVSVFIALSMSAWPTGSVSAEEPEPLSPLHAVTAAPRDWAPESARNRRRLMGDVGTKDRGMVNSRRLAEGRHAWRRRVARVWEERCRARGRYQGIGIAMIG